MEMIKLLIASLIPFLCLSLAAGHLASVVADRLAGETLCGSLIEPAGYPCEEHTVQTEDGYLLGLQRVSSSNGGLRLQRGPPVLLIHGLFMGGDAWFLHSPDQSLGYVLADHGYDVWAASVRGTFWSCGHVSMSVKDKEFWDFSWEDLALYDVAAMIKYIYETTNSKVYIVGHSQGTIVSWAAFTQQNIVEMVEAAALLSPISYLDHITAPLPVQMVNTHFDQMLVAMGIRELDFRKKPLVDFIDFVCDGWFDCNDVLSVIAGPNCCLNMSNVDFFFVYEPHPTSTKNFRHLFQMIRQGTFARYDYGTLKNLKKYGQSKPPKFDLSLIPKSLPIWMTYGGKDGLADVTDVMHTLSELQSKPQLLFLENYGHIDFILSVTAKDDFFGNLMEFFGSVGNNTSRTSSM